jgi:hypothetical protein
MNFKPKRLFIILFKTAHLTTMEIKQRSLLVEAATLFARKYMFAFGLSATLTPKALELLFYGRGNITYTNNK